MPSAWQQRVDAADWGAVTAELNDVGGALLPELMTAAECAAVLDLYTDERLFRATVDMGSHRYGQGEYRYLKQPYPSAIEALKQALYPRLLPIARDWWSKLGRDAPWPDTLDEWLEICHRAGQTKSTALLLKYGAGDWNALHRDLYGDLVFPLQVVINLNEPGVAHTCREDRATSSPPGNGRSARYGDGRPLRYAMAFQWFAPARAAPSA